MQIKNPTSYAGVNYHSNDTAQSFSHPDFTVGSGISPDQLLHCVGYNRSRTIPPVGNYTRPRRITIPFML